MTFNRIRSGVFIIKNNKMLLFQRPAGYWYFPGGRIENNETAERCAVREAKEETGIKAKIIKLIYVHQLRKHRTLELIYLAKPIGGKFRLGVNIKENNRLKNLKYIPINSLNKIQFLAPRIIPQLKKDIRNNFKNCPRDLGISKISLKKIKKTL